MVDRIILYHLADGLRLEGVDQDLFFGSKEHILITLVEDEGEGLEGPIVLLDLHLQDRLSLVDFFEAPIYISCIVDLEVLVFVYEQPKELARS